MLAAGPPRTMPTVPTTTLAPGELRGDEVGAGGGTRLVLRTVQPEGKRPMDAADWLHGVRPGPDDRLGA